MNTLIRFALNQRPLILMMAALLIGVGIWAFRVLPIDAVPDITTVQVQINTQVKALAPAEVEKLVTFPIEASMGGIPNIEQVRSLTKYGLSQVTVVFKDGTDIYWARQRVFERLQEARENLPEGLAEPVMGPVSTGLGEIFLYTVEGEGYPPRELRAMQDWMIKPQLRTVAGVAEVNSIGGYEKHYYVLPDPVKLAAYGLTFHDVATAVGANNANVGGAYIEHKGEQYLIRGVGLAQTTDDLQNIVVTTTKHGAPVYVRDVAEVTVGDELRTGTATEKGREVVIGTAMMLIGENSRTVSIRVREKLEKIQTTLPKGVTINPVYDRTYLVNDTIGTVSNNLFEGGVLVIVVLLVFLGNVRAALIVASAIPLSMLFALTGMVQTKTSGNLMSLGAIDFGLIVDGAVIMAENLVRRLAEQQHKLGRPLTPDEQRQHLTAAALEMGRPVTFGVAIIMIVFLPILTLQGIEGKMFGPMAIVMLLALAGSLLLALTLVPVLCSLTLGRKFGEKENWLMRQLSRVYAPSLRWSLRWRWVSVGGAVGVVVLAGWMFTRLGATFVPQLDEGSLAIQVLRLPSISLTQSLEMQSAMEKAIVEFPEVETVFARVGTAEVATDPMGVNVADVYVMLKPRKEWKTVKTKAELIEKIQERLAPLAGQNYSFSQPIELRFNELIAGVRADVAVKVFGDDMDELSRIAAQVNELLGKVQGAEDVQFEQTSGLPVMQMEMDRQALARYGLNVVDVLDLIETAIGGKETGQLFEGERRFDIVVRLPGPLRQQLDELKQLTVKTSTGALIPLSQLSRIEIVEGLNQISRENGKRRVAVQCNVRGRDIASFVEEVQRRVDEEIKPLLSVGYYVEYGGQFENLRAARQRLAIVVPAALALIFFLLFTAFRSVRQSLLIFTGVPMAATGGVFALALCDLPFSISAGVGFIALSGVAVLDGVVMFSSINALREAGRSFNDAVFEGTMTRLRAILMTALVATLGFVPMAIATGTGAEVQRPLAIVVIGGLITSTFLKLLVLPVLYHWFENEKGIVGARS